MSQLRAWFGDEPEYKTFSSRAQAIKFVKKLLKEHDEEECGLEEFLHGEWDEWLDDDDQNIHEYLYMIANEGGDLDDDEEEEDDDDFDDDDFEEEEESFEEDDDFEEEDRLINAISGNVSRSAASEDFDEDLDDDEDDEDFDDEDEDA